MTGVTIIGGGASGVLLAAHLLRDPDADISVTLIEKAQLGQGVAYSASQHDHRVNVPARGMSAFADDAEKFAFLQTKGNIFDSRHRLVQVMGRESLLQSLQFNQFVHGSLLFPQKPAVFGISR